MDDIDLEGFRLQNSMVPRDGRPVTREKKLQVEPFIRGPLPLGWFIRASQIPRRNALVVALVLWHLAGMAKAKSRLVFCVARCTPFGLGRKSVARGLRDLEEAGLVCVERVRGRCARVDLLESKGSATEDNA